LFFWDFCLFAIACFLEVPLVLSFQGKNRKKNFILGVIYRVYYDDCWWDLDVTNDITSTANGKSLYGFRELTSAYASDKDYYITKIY